MKANAPEKLYISPNSFKIGEVINSILTTKSEDDIEYIRTDAFIGKAEEFIKKINDVDEYSWYNEEEHTAGITEKCIEDFKKYIKR